MQNVRKSFAQHLKRPKKQTICKSKNNKPDSDFNDGSQSLGLDSTFRSVKFKKVKLNLKLKLLTLDQLKLSNL